MFLKPRNLYAAASESEETTTKHFDNNAAGTLDGGKMLNLESSAQSCEVAV
jgi:hypothetical protein